MLKRLISGCLGAAVVVGGVTAVGCAAKSYHDIERAAAPGPTFVPRAVPAPQAAPAEAYPVIVRLRGRDKTVTVTAGPRGPLFSAVTSTGQSVVSNATLDELRAGHPDVYDFVHPAMVVRAFDSADASAPVPTADVWGGRQ